MNEPPVFAARAGGGAWWGGPRSLRGLLLLAVFAGAAYMVVFSGIIVLRIVPTSEAMLVESHTAIAAWSTRIRLDSTLERATDGVRDLLLQAAQTPPEAIDAVADRLRELADSGWSAQASRALVRAPAGAQELVARAMAAESGAVSALVDAANELQLGRPTSAVRALSRSDSLRHIATDALLAIETPAYYALFDGQRTVLGLANAARRLTVWWAVGGAVLFLAFFIAVHRLLYRPLAQLEGGLRRVAEGDLEVHVTVPRSDEVRRLTELFNAMMNVMRDRSAAARRRAQNLAERLGRVLDDSPSEIFIFEAESFRFLQVNEGGRRNLGMTPEDLATRRPIDVLPEFDEVSFADLLRPLRDGATAQVAVSTTLRRADGTAYPVDLNIQLSKREEPQVFVAVAQDATERVRLRTERERILDLSVDLLVTSRLDGELVSVNSASRWILGFMPEEMVGCAMHEVVHLDDAPVVLSALERLAAGEAVRGQTVRMRCKDGGYRSISWNCDPPVDGMLYGIGRDVTDAQEEEQRRAELRSAVERAAREWTMTFDAIGDPVLIVNGSGHVIRLNEAGREVAGRHHRDLIGCPIAKVGGDAFWSRVAEVVADVRRSGRPTSIQVHCAQRDRTWDVDATPVAQGIASGDGTIIVVAHDISNLVQLQESVRRQETMVAMGSLLAGVAHEVRNPLFSMTATLDAFEARRGAGTCAPHLNILRDQLSRLQQLMQDLLEYGKPQALELSAVALEDVAEQAVAATAVLAGEAGVTVRCIADRRLPPVRGDHLRLAQVYTNLITNAIQHSPSGAAITVRLHAFQQDGRHWAEVAVVDDGPGFHANDLPHVFEPFFTRRKGGTGLGLALVRGIVDQHGGTVAAETGVSGGGIVRVRLPLAVT